MCESDDFLMYLYLFVTQHQQSMRYFTIEWSFCVWSSRWPQQWLSIVMTFSWTFWKENIANNYWFLIELIAFIEQTINLLIDTIISFIMSIDSRCNSSKQVRWIHFMGGVNSLYTVRRIHLLQTGVNILYIWLSIHLNFSANRTLILTPWRD